MTYTGRDVRRLEDADLLRGARRFADDLPVRRDILHAAILRSPHAHAEILSVDAEGALALPGVDCVVTPKMRAAGRGPSPSRSRRRCSTGVSPSTGCAMSASP